MSTSDGRLQQLTERLQRQHEEMHAPITDANMLGCIEELRELFLRRRIAADCTLVLPGLTVHFRLKGPPPAATTTPDG